MGSPDVPNRVPDGQMGSKMGQMVTQIGQMRAHIGRMGAHMGPRPIFLWVFVSHLADLACGVGRQVERYRLGGWVGGSPGGITAGIPLNKK